MRLEIRRSTGVRLPFFLKAYASACLLACSMAVSVLAAGTTLDDRIIVFLADPADKAAIAKSYRLTIAGQGRVGPLRDCLPDQAERQARGAARGPC